MHMKRIQVLLIFEDELGSGRLLEELIRHCVKKRATDLEWNVVRNIDIRLDSTDLFLNFDVIILHNMNMPPPDGYAILEFLAANGVRVPVFYASFGLDRECMNRAAEKLPYCMEFEKLGWYGDANFMNVIRYAVKTHPVLRHPVGIIRCPAFDEFVIRRLAARSEELYLLPSRKFEELLAQLLKESGWQVELYPIGADGGIDIIGVRSYDPVPHRMLVQAKRYAKHRRVGVEAVREILYLVNDKGFNSGLIATTSTFTRVAVKERELHPWRLQLKDHAAIVDWLNQHACKEPILRVDT